jgi:protein-S-isoprenylcysteine O-methyltransferase Ste14
MVVRLYPIYAELLQFGEAYARYRAEVPALIPSLV